MKFYFPFEKLLEHRKRQEDHAQRDYLLARSQFEVARAELDEMYNSITRARLKAGNLRTRGGDCSELLRQTDFFIAGQEVRIERQKLKIRELASVTEEKHAILIEASQESKKVARVREKMWDRHLRAVKKKEMKDLDDLVTMRFAREVK